MVRRNVLLFVSLALTTVAVVQQWPLRATEREFDPGACSIEELRAGLQGEHGHACFEELRARAWRRGPALIEPLLAEGDQPELGRFDLMFVGIPPRECEPDAAMVKEWRNQLVAMLAADGDRRWAAMSSLAILTRDEHLEEPPAKLLSMIRLMLRSPDDQQRISALLTASQLCEHARSLLDDVLSIDGEAEASGTKLRVVACMVLEHIGTGDARAVAYLMDALRGDDEDVRASAAAALAAVATPDDDVLAALRTVLDDEGAVDATRIAALLALSKLVRDPEQAAGLLPITIGSFERFEPWYELAEYVGCVARLAVRAQDASSRALAVEAIRRCRFPGAAVPGALARIAAAYDDQALLDAVMPDLRELLSDPDLVYDLQVYYGYFDWWLAFEGLVDVCLWRRDLRLRDRVRDRLRDIDRLGSYGARTWARSLLARLDV